MLCAMLSPRPTPLLLTLLITAALAACSTSMAEQPKTRRSTDFIIKTTTPWLSTPALADEVARRTGIAVVRAQAISPTLFSVTMACADADCQPPIERLRADTRFAIDVQPDQRRTAPRTPGPASSQ
jgi:hypothetical protein